MNKTIKYTATQTYPELDPGIQYLPYGQAKYGSLKKDYPQHWESFRNIHDRCRRMGIEIDYHFRRNIQGLANLIECLGPVPEGMRYPTVGRIDHSRGYLRDNIRWQERSANSREAVDRRHLPKRYMRLKSLITMSPDLSWLGITWQKSTTISWWWNLNDMPCTSNNVPPILDELAKTFKGKFKWDIAEKGKGRRPHFIQIEMCRELIAEVESYDDASPTNSLADTLAEF